MKLLLMMSALACLIEIPLLSMAAPQSSKRLHDQADENNQSLLMKALVTSRERSKSIEITIHNPLHEAPSHLVRSRAHHDRDGSYAAKGVHPLLEAAAHGDCERVRKLIEHEGMMVNSCDELGLTALMVAVARGNCACAQLLIELGALVNQVTQSGKSALDIARMAGKPACIKLLKEHSRS